MCRFEFPLKVSFRAVGEDSQREGSDRLIADWPRLEREIKALLKGTPLSVVGARLRRYRIRQGFSIRDLASKAGVSTNSVLRIEQGGGVHSLTILKICGALGLHVVRLGDIENLEPAGISAVHHREDDRWFELTDFGAGPVEDRPLSPEERSAAVERGVVTAPLMIMRSRLEAGRLRPTVIELYKETERRSHAGEEFVYVITGTVTMVVGNETHLLREGEGITFWSAEEHSYAPSEDSELPARVLVVQVDDNARPTV
jgi:transcriptional regulator with XRE-family HTH domain